MNCYNFYNMRILSFLLSEEFQEIGVLHQLLGRRLQVNDGIVGHGLDHVLDHVLDHDFAVTQELDQRLGEYLVEALELVLVWAGLHLVKTKDRLVGYD